MVPIMALCSSMLMCQQAWLEKQLSSTIENSFTVRMEEEESLTEPVMAGVRGIGLVIGQCCLKSQKSKVNRRKSASDLTAASTIAFNAGSPHGGLQYQLNL